MQLWSPFARRAINVGIIKADQTVTFKSQEKATEIKSHWGKVFSAKSINVEKAAGFLRKNCTPIDLSKMRMPSTDSIQTFLDRVAHSAPGPDGIPYRCWLAAGEPGLRTLYRALRKLYNGELAPEDFNDQLGIFPPKGSADDDTILSVNRTADCTRPLGLKNTDNKILSGVTNSAITPAITDSAHGSQNGFVAGRQGINNVVTLDAQSRIADLKANAQVPLQLPDIPLLTLYDFCAAFPSIVHNYIFMVLVAAGLPTGLINFFRALYHNNRCFATFDGEVIFLYKILSGIIQGCPASGTVFVICVDPFLRLLNEVVKDPTICAFADDIGAIVPSLQQLHHFHKSFSLFEQISGLALKANKCVIIPLGRALTEDLENQIKQFLRNHIPTWARFNISDKAEYLGFSIGPKGGNDESWEKPLNKYNNRVSCISKAKLAPSIATDLYAIKAFPVNTYIPQLCKIIPKVLKEEHKAIHKILHLPFNTLPKHSAFCLDEIGMRRLPSIEIMSKAVLTRAAVF